MNDALSARQDAAAEWFEKLQRRLIAAFEALEDEAPGRDGSGAGRFDLKPWSRTDHSGAPGGGGRMALLRGRLFEKAGIHSSVVFGTFAPEFAAQIKGAESDPRFWAAGLSLIAHPWSPEIPTVHLNTRFVVTTRQWFGGGAEPLPGRDDEARVEMNGRNFRAPGMRDQRQAGGPEARIALGAFDLRCEFRRESPEHDRRMYARLFEQAAAQKGHAAAAARRAGMVGARPWLQFEPPGPGAVAAGRFVLERLERGDEPALKLFEPFGGSVLARRQRIVHSAPLLVAGPDLADRFAERDCRRDADIERARRRPDRNAQARVGRRMDLVGNAGRFAPDQDHVAGGEGEIPMRDLGPRRQQNEPARARSPPFLEGAPRIMARDRHLVEIIHAGPAEMTIRTRKAGRPDDRRGDAETGAAPQHRAGVLGDVRLVKRQRQTHRLEAHRLALKPSPKKEKPESGPGRDGAAEKPARA